MVMEETSAQIFAVSICTWN